MNADPVPLHPAMSSTRPSDLVGALRRRVVVVLVCAIVGAALGVVYVKAAEVTYEARSTVLLLALPDEKSPGGGLQRTLDVETQATIARSTTLLEQVGDALDLSAAGVRSRSRVEAAPTGDVLYIWFTDDDPSTAAAGSLAYTQAFLAQRKEVADEKARGQQDLLQQQIDELQDEVDRLTALVTQATAALPPGADTSTEVGVLRQRQSLAIERAATLTDQRATIDTNLNPGRILVDPRQSVERAGFDPKLVVLAGISLGLLIGALLALLVDRHDDRYGTGEALAERGAREIARLRLPQGGQASPAMRRAYARLLVRLGRIGRGTGGRPGSRSVLVTAVESSTLPPGVVDDVIDALVREGAEVGVAARVLHSEAALAAGAARSDVPAWNGFDAALEDLRAHSDLTLVSAPPLDRSVAALSVAQRVDEVVLLVSSSTRLAHLDVALDDLGALDARNIGIVVVRGRRRGAPRATATTAVSPATQHG